MQEALMHIFLAPMEGITDSIYRRLHASMFSGVEKYYIPFVSPSQNLCFSPREKYLLDPKENQDIPTVPQLLAKDASLFLWAAGEIREMGYGEVNLNLGCPASTVTAKGKGSAMLKDIEALSRFLDDIFEKSPLPVSLKTRIGYDSLALWPDLSALFARYPFSEVIIHPRLREEFYQGMPHQEAFIQSLSLFSCPVIYNGDIFRKEEGESLLARRPDIHGLMLGRGILCNPALARELQGGEKLKKEELKAFHDALFLAYREKYDAHIALMRMKALMTYMGCCFEQGDKIKKAMKKATNEKTYLPAAEQLFASCALKADPHFYWEK